MPNGYTFTTRCVHMDDIDPDTLMIAAGVVISLVAAVEFYAAWERARSP